MVYCGRPSKGCQRCRVKRLKCNQQRPSCIQCQTSGVTCSGYRNEIDLLFRDESTSVVRKFVDSQNRKPPSRKKTSKISDLKKDGDRSKNQQLSHNKSNLDDSLISYRLLTRVPQTPIEKAATAFLLTSYLEGSNFNYIPEMYKKSSAESLLSNVVEAVALAAFSNEVSQSSILELARKSYARSMHMAHEILDSPNLITTDETLASTLLLSRFETLPRNCERDAIFESWSKHVLGSLSIVQLRDQEQNFNSHISRKMYTQVIANLNLYRVLCPSFEPEASAYLKLKALEALGPLDSWALLEFRSQFLVVTEEIFEMRRAILESPITEYRSVLKRAVALGKRSSQAFSVMAGAGFAYEVVHAPPQSEISNNLMLYSDVYYVYKNAQEAQFWNSARMRSLGLNDALIDYALDLIDRRDRGTLPGYDPAIDEDFEHVVTTCQNDIDCIVDDICNSAPQFLRPGHPDCTVSACCYLVWPLFVATRSSKDRIDISSERRCMSFVVERLTWMAEHMKIPIARMVVEWLKSDRPGGAWLHPYRDDFIIPFYCC